jgi:hypothetical protein
MWYNSKVRIYFAIIFLQKKYHHRKWPDGVGGGAYNQMIGVIFHTQFPRYTHNQPPEPQTYQCSLHHLLYVLFYMYVLYTVQSTFIV